MNPKRVRLLVSGKVQGVYFRQGTMETAEKNNVFGWVRNLPDDKVEAILEGESSNVDAVVEWAQFGPAGASVKDLQIFEEKYLGEFSDFQIHY